MSLLHNCWGVKTHKKVGFYFARDFARWLRLVWTPRPADGRGAAAAVAPEQRMSVSR